MKKSPKDIVEKKDDIMKPKKTGNSIKKNKDVSNGKAADAPRPSTMPNIMTMLS